MQMQKNTIPKFQNITPFIVVILSQQNVSIMLNLTKNKTNKMKKHQQN